MHDAGPGRSEFDRQGDSVEAPADVGDDGGLIGRRCEAWTGLARATSYKVKRSLTISSETGGEQQLKVADSATITRDGTQAGLDQIKEGDQVRASFDASGNQASKLEVSSKQKGDKSEMKTQSKDK